jgi:dihydrofolate reductase
MGTPIRGPPVREESNNLLVHAPSQARKEAVMRKLIAQEWMSLDGVVQAPGAPDEDTRGGFDHGGWHLPYFDQASQQWVVDNLTHAGGFVLGRRTYESFAGHWPNASEEEQPIAEPLNKMPKYVATTTLRDPLEWQNSSVLGPDVPAAIRSLKEEDGDDLLVIGSTRLMGTLMEHDLIEEYRLMVDPLVLGSGTRLFSDMGARLPLALVDSQVTTTGAILATYARAEDAPG